MADMMLLHLDCRQLNIACRRVRDTAPGIQRRLTFPQFEQVHPARIERVFADRKIDAAGVAARTADHVCVGGDMGMPLCGRNGHMAGNDDHHSSP